MERLLQQTEETNGGIMKKILLLVVLTLNVFTVKIKEAFKDPVQTDAKSAEFSANCSSVFGLMGMSPAKINTFGSFKEVKVDWFWGKDSIQDNIAVEFNPFWYIFFANMNHKKYQELPYLAKKVGDVALSIGNKKVGTNHDFGIALNFNLYKKADPVCDKKLLKDIKSVVNRMDLLRVIAKKEIMLDMASGASKAKLKAELVDLKNELHTRTTEEEAKIAKIIYNYKSENWNQNFINLGSGYIFAYHLTSDLKLTPMNHSVAIWLHTGFPIKNFCLVSILNRYYFNDLICNGINFRFGSSEIKNVFIETLAYNNIKDGDLSYYNINFGGITPLSKKKKDMKLSLGFNFVFDNTFSLTEIRPTYNFNLGF